MKTSPSDEGFAVGVEPQRVSVLFQPVRDGPAHAPGSTPSAVPANAAAVPADAPALPAAPPTPSPAHPAELHPDPRWLRPPEGGQHGLHLSLPAR